MQVREKMIVCFLFAAMWLCSPVRAEPASPSIIYQGQLKQAGVPVSGPIDVVISMWDAVNSGAQVGASQVLNAVPVSNGLFQVELDFGATAFQGEARWLEVQVDGVALTPRQPVAATPRSLSTRGIVVDSQNNVGIGTSTPIDQLHVLGNQATLRLEDDDDPLSFSQFEDASPGQLRISKVSDSVEALLDLNPKPLNGTGPAFVRIFRETDTTGPKGVVFKRGNNTNTASAQIGVDGTDSFFQLQGGNLGIGTSAPKQSLHNTGDYYGRGHVYLHAFDGDGVDGTAYLQARDDSGTSSIGLQLRTQVGGAIRDTMHLAADGNVGIGTNSPAGKLDVQGDININNIGDQATVLGLGIERSWVFRQQGTGSSTALKLQSIGGGGNKNFLIETGGSVGIGTLAPQAKLHVAGTMRCDVVEIMGADLAEKFPVSGSLEPGTVVSIDSTNPGMLRRSRTAYDRTVAGVISGANGLPVGALLGHLAGSGDHPPIALSGRVWVKCDASEHAIVAGDMLTTSSVSGCAMKAADPTRAFGAVIGKAMTPLARGENGFVLALVNLQ